MTKRAESALPAERVDRAFPAWQQLAFVGGAYRPYDLNQPLQARPFCSH